MPAAMPASCPSWPAGIAALVPVYNHGGLVGAVVQGLVKAGAPLVLAVDDGSYDGSGAAAAAAGATVLRLATNQGKGAALRTGLAELERRGWAQALSIDADGQHPLAAALTLAAAASAAPQALHVGHRTMGHAPLASRVGRWCSDLGARCAGGRWPGDSQSGLRVYPLPATTRLGVGAGRFAFEIEVLVRAAWAGIEVHAHAVPVDYPADRISHFRRLRDSAAAAGLIARLLRERLARRRAASAPPWRCGRRG